MSRPTTVIRVHTAALISLVSSSIGDTFLREPGIELVIGLNFRVNISLKSSDALMSTTNYLQNGIISTIPGSDNRHFKMLTSLDFNYVKPCLVMQQFDSTIGLIG